MQLNVEQTRIIKAKPSGYSLLKGVAGSGKTTVAVNRIPFLVNHYCIDRDDKVLVVTYNKTLINYIKYIYDKVEEENKLDYLSLLSDNEDRLDIMTIDKLLYRYFIEYKKENKLKLNVISSNAEKYPIINQCILTVKNKYPHIKLLDPRNTTFIIDEIDWIKSCGYLNVEEYESADRLGRMSSSNNEGPQRLLKNSDVRRSIFDVMLLYDKCLKDKNLIDFKSMAVLALRQAKKKPIKKYTHIIIDESQDLTRIQLELINTLYNKKLYSSILFVADTAQSIYPHSWLVKGRSFTSIGIDMTGKSNSLAKNYRTTAQIAEAAYSLIENDTNITEDDNYVKPSLIDKQGHYPVCRCFNNFGKEASFIINEIKNKLLNKFELKDIVIIAKKKNQLQEMLSRLEKEHIPAKLFETKEAMDFDYNGIKLLTMHSIKGLEFNVVFIFGLNSNVIPFYSYLDNEDKSLQESMDRKLLYVGMTRANELLYLTCNKEPSKFLKDIDYRYVKLNLESKIRKYHEIKIDEYEFKDKIIDLYSNEEKIRQWVIKELTVVYKYPKEIIDIEHKVNCFSKAGRIDICVNIYKNKVKVPFIFIEVKRKGTDLTDAINQVMSYMSTSSTCQYGAATDGNEFIVINKDNDVINDIPAFDNTMLPSSIEYFEYKDLRHNKTFKISRDINEILNLAVKDDRNEEELLEEEELLKINIYSNIAAGIPIYINSDRQGIFYLPDSWFKGMNSIFMLKVRGDSMNGAGIENGDLIVLEKRETAENREIAAVDIEGNAALKRFMKMGDTILLISENPAYEPIQIRSGEARILGVAVGVIKEA